MSTSCRRYYPNPDDNFVMQGGSPAFYWNQPGFRTNSMLTTTTKNLSQHHYNADAYGDDPQLRGSLRTVSRSLNRSSGDLKRLLLEDEANYRSTHSYNERELNEALRNALNNYRPHPALLSRTEWYTKPIHLSSSVRVPLSRDDMLAERYFPVTLGASKSLELLDDIRPGQTRPRSRSKKRDTKKRANSAKSQRDKSNEARRLDNLYLLSAEAPNIKGADISFTSPYTDELARLRLDKLRIEEKQYLELKRLAELERIRGPLPKWYEMKGPEFHREAGKNNELLRNSDKWDDLLKYRESLINATNRLKTALDNYD